MAATKTRVDELLEATCRVVAREGAHGLRMSAVAREAGVSSALLHYYFATKAELLSRAFGYAEERVRERAKAELADLETGAERLERLLALYVEDDLVFRENWVLWNELWASALFDPDLRPAIEAGYRDWLGRIESLLAEGRADGSVPADVEPAEAAARLAAVLDGLGSQVVLGMIDPERAAALVRRALELELGAEPRRR
jgi:AcrR family transcriptional regulator